MVDERNWGSNRRVRKGGGEGDGLGKCHMFHFEKQSFISYLL